jgi:Tol biopolymer transport system component
VAKTLFSYLYIFFILSLYSCSIEVNQTVESTPAPVIESTPAASSTSLFPVTQVPVTWADLNLSGKLVYLSSSMQDNVLIASIRMLDLTSGTVATIFSAPPGGWIYYLTLSSDGRQIVMSYTPAPEAGSEANRALYIMPLNTSTPPQPLVQAPTSDDHYTQAEWSPDGQSIYFVHYNHAASGGQFYEVYEIFRMTYPDGEPNKILDRAFWPRLSADSTKLVYVSLDPASGLNELFTANADGSNSQKVNFSGPWIPDIIDAPIFSPDDQAILFSAPGPSQSYQPNWLDKVLGIQVAKAHSIPSDWWSIPITGGVPTQLTKLQTINLFASLSPDKTRIISVSGEGLFTMNLDGSNLTRIISDSGVHGTVTWIP